jgi:hypothetical protein
VADALTAELTQPQGAQQPTHGMAASQSPLGALQPLANSYMNMMMRQRMQQANGAGMFGGGSPNLPSGLDLAGGPAYG